MVCKGKNDVHGYSYLIKRVCFGKQLKPKALAGVEKMNITYSNNLSDISKEGLTDFFVGWPAHPGPKTHYKILKNSFAVWLAIDGDRCVGFINALSDSIFYSYIPLLEVLPEYQGNGIGSELVKRMIETLDKMYAIDVVCDESVESFYKNLEFKRCVGMVKRNHRNQSGTQLTKVL